jgi:hypothetical protein
MVSISFPLIVTSVTATTLLPAFTNPFSFSTAMAFSKFFAGSSLKVRKNG